MARLNLLRIQHYGTAPQILALTVLWAAALVGVDYARNPRPLGSFFAKSEAQHVVGDVATPQIVLFMNHMCCSGCLDELQSALKQLTWISKVEIDKGSKLVEHDQVNDELAKSVQSYSGRVDLEIGDLKAVDFVALDQAIRSTGLSVDKIEFGGLPHYRLEAAMKHLCCQFCTKALDGGMQLAKQFRAGGQFNWIDSAQVDKNRKTLVVFARYSHVVDISEFMQALGHLGFVPTSLRILPGDET
jgi:hypothetical protein